MEHSNSGDEDRGFVKQAKEQETHKERLTKRLVYILRYGALKEGLMVDDSGRY